jgi:integrase
MPKPAPPETIAAALIRGDGDTQVMVLLGALAGLRRAEIAGLQRGDLYLDAEPPVIHVRAGKGAKDRVVPIHPTLLAHLRRETCWLFRPRVGYTVDAVGDRLARALTIDGVRITAHQLRHYFGTEAARWSGGNVVLVSQLMGHTNTDTTMGYIKWTPAEGAEVVAKIVTAGVDDVLTERRLRAV